MTQRVNASEGSAQGSQAYNSSIVRRGCATGKPLGVAGGVEPGGVEAGGVEAGGVEAGGVEEGGSVETGAMFPLV